MPNLLVVDDEQSICWGLKRLGESMGHTVETASSAEQAIELIDQQPADVLILDVRLPGMDGLTAIRQFRQRLGSVPIIVITAYGDLETAVETVRQGAFEYLVKPFDLEQVQRVITRALESNQPTDNPSTQPQQVGGMVGATPVMQEVFKRIALASASDASVLLLGESGTGKEIAARAVHQYSQRAEQPFVAVNVASLNPSLAESELFGHVRGAFTGADQPRTGLMVQADGGTLFLDEVADIPLPTQVKLLRALERGEVTPVGSSESIRSNFRVVSATHQPLLDLVRQGRFRHDLYFRLCTFQIEIPPLRDRRQDVLQLAQHFLHSFSNHAKAARSIMADETLAELVDRDWRGNVRELRNAIEHALIVARGGTILPEHLPAPIAPAVVEADSRSLSPAEQLGSAVGNWAQQRLHNAPGNQLYQELLQLVEPPLFRATLEKNRGQCAAAARCLGLHRATLRKKLDQYGIDGS